MAASCTRALDETFLSSLEQGPLGPLLDPQTRLDRFTIVRHLGSGRTAHVYLARDEVQGNEVALKVCGLTHDQAPSSDQRVALELAVWRRLGGHPNVLTLFDVHRAQFAGLDLVLLSMEYADGLDLRAWLTRNREKKTLCGDEGVQVVIAVAQGLAAMHRAGITHFDVKPENIFCANGVWKIGDLDHAFPALPREATASGSETDPGPEVRGTPGYRSPEMEDPAPDVADARADVYALGVVLREVLGLDGRRLVPRTSSTQSVMNARLARIVKRCLSPDPNGRFQVLEHLIEALDLARRGERIQQGNHTVHEQEDRWRRVLRCLAAGQADDARRLSQVLLATCPHHPGANALIRNIQRQHDQAVMGANELSENMAKLSLDETIRRLRPIVDLAPHHEQVITIVEAVETRVVGSRNALLDVVALLQAGDLGRAAEALRQCAEHDSDNTPAAEACAALGEWDQRLSSSQRQIEAAVAERRYGEALRILRNHRKWLDTTSAHAPRIRATLDGVHCVGEAAVP